MIFVRQIGLRRWIPSNDSFATCVARMSILREDFAIEMNGIYEDDLSALDGNTPEYRRVYFWRNMLRTLFEVRSVLVQLKANTEFSTALSALIASPDFMKYENLSLGHFSCRHHPFAMRQS
jgi:hypothetical protein